MQTPTFIQLHRIDDRALADEAAAGLLAAQAHVSPKFFYDPLGSRLFDAITELQEYYPTRTEAAIFAVHGAAMAEAALDATGAGPVMVDLGAGNCAKAARLFGRLAPRRYVAVDISVDFLRDSLQHLQREHPAMQMVGVGPGLLGATATARTAGRRPRPGVLSRLLDRQLLARAGTAPAARRAGHGGRRRAC